jgi:hypothetical protein
MTDRLHITKDENNNVYTADAHNHFTIQYSAISNPVYFSVNRVETPKMDSHELTAHFKGNYTYDVMTVLKIRKTFIKTFQPKILYTDLYPGNNGKVL